MGDVMMLILGFIAGFLCAAYGAAKLVKDQSHKSYLDGLRDGMKATEAIALSVKDAKEVNENGNC